MMLQTTSSSVPTLADDPTADDDPFTLTDDAGDTSTTDVVGGYGELRLSKPTSSGSTALGGIHSATGNGSSRMSPMLFPFHRTHSSGSVGASLNGSVHPSHGATPEDRQRAVAHLLARSDSFSEKAPVEEELTPDTVRDITSSQVFGTR